MIPSKLIKLYICTLKAVNVSYVQLLTWVSEGRGKGAKPRWILKILANNVVFLILSGENQISLLLFTPWKNFEKIPQWYPLGKKFSGNHGCLCRMACMKANHFKCYSANSANTHWSDNCSLSLTLLLPRVFLTISYRMASSVWQVLFHVS